MQKEKNCACNKQIVWFYEKPTVIACKECEITFYHETRTCPYCDREVSYFVEEEEEEE